MSLSILLLSLSIISGVFCVYMSAKQFVRQDTVTWINEQTIPVWVWILGIFISSLLTTLEILRYFKILYLFPTILTNSVYIMTLLALTGYAVIVILIQFSHPHAILNSREKLRRSILSGFVASFGLSTALSIIWILLDSTAASSVGGLICLLIPTQIIATIGTYSQLGWQKKLSENAKAYYEKHIPMDGDGPS